MDLRNYKQVAYKDLQKRLHEKKSISDIHDLNLAAQLDIKSVGTIRNAFNLDKQEASDEVLTKIFNALGLDAFVGWVNGERRYFISK